MKLLAPAGNFQALKTAVYNGADEVYFGVNDFNARNNIDGFSVEQVKEAVDFAHIFGVKVLLAVNILFNDNEISDAIKLIVECYNCGVDAFIVQDIGLMSILYKCYPSIPLHASTQMGIHNLEGVVEVEKLGVKRVVLSRETSISEIKRIKANSSVEIEYFVHGALCVSFSGNCYLSGKLFNASGNRGKCKQLCRLPYTLCFKGKPIKRGYLLSAKDFCLINKLGELKKAGVDVLKIEGRARRAGYVGAVVREYKKALADEKTSSDNLKLAFNRGFTEGYFNGNESIISNVQNHIGIRVGKVLSVNNGKKFNQITFSSNHKISPKSTIKLFDGENEVNTVSVYDIKFIKNGTYMFTTTQKIKSGTTVRLVLDNNKEKEILSFKSKIPLKIEVNIVKNQPVCIRAGDTIFYGDVFDSAINNPLTKEEFIDNFKKNDFFVPQIIFCNFDSVFIPKGALNSLRRKFYEKYVENLTDKSRKNLFFSELKDVPSFNDVGWDNICVYSPEEYVLSDIKEYVLSCKNQGKFAFLDLPNYATEKDIDLLKRIVKETGIGVVANNLYGLTFNTDVIVGAGLNVYNRYTAKYFNKPVMSFESDIGRKINYPLMTLRHCPIKSHVGGSCVDCKFSDSYTYVLDEGKSMLLKRKKLSTCTFYLE